MQRTFLSRCQRLGHCGFAPNCVCDVDPTDPRDTASWRKEACPHVTPPKNLSEPCQTCGALGPWFDSGDCAFASADGGGK